MKRVALTGLVLLVLSAVVGWAAGEMRQVQVEKTTLRATPGFLGRPTGELRYGTPVQVLAVQGEWAQVLAGGQQGWLRSSALAAAGVKLQATDANVSAAASREEMALAGRGFSQEVENAYRNSHGNLDYSTLDSIERSYNYGANEIARFLSDGGLLKEGGK